MFLPSDLLQKRVNDVDFKLIAATIYDMERISAATETGGLAINGSVNQTITTGGTTQIVTNWTEDYQEKVIVGTPAAGTLVTTADLDFDITLTGKIVRQTGPGGKVELEILSSGSAVIGTVTLEKTSQKIQDFSITIAAEDLGATDTVTLNINGETVTGEVYVISDCAFFMESV